MATIDLYVNEIVSGGTWTQVGTTPYLDTQNQPTSYIHSTSRNANSSVYGFTNSSDLGTISKVELFYYSVWGGGYDDFTIYCNGSPTGGYPATSWGWLSVDVTSIVGTTWAGVNAATFYADKPNTANDPSIDAAYLKVTYAGSISVNQNDQNPTVTDASQQYINPYLVNQADDNPDITDESLQYINPYLIEQSDNITDVQDYANVAVSISVNINDDISLQEGSQQYITPHLISVYDQIGLNDYLDASIAGLTISLKIDLWQIVFQTTTLAISRFDNLGLTDESQQYLTNYIVNIYDDIGLTDESNQYLTIYQINVSDDIGLQDSATAHFDAYLITITENIGLTDDSSQYLTIYEIYQFDEITVTDDETVQTVGIGIRSIEVYENVAVQDETNEYLNLYEIIASEDLTIEDYTDNALDLFLIDEADSVTVSEEPIAYITPYLVSEYENVNVSDYANLVEEYGDKEASVNDLVAIEDYANVAMAIYPFLQGFLTIKSTRSILDISQTMSELDVSDTNTIVSITR